MSLLDAGLPEDNKDSLSLSDDEDNDDEIDYSIPETHGTLSKWTNYIHGWQDRYIVLKEGTLSYYKSENETTFGCRGAISLAKAVLQAHEFDECRFDCGVNDCLWYLRARNEGERQMWMDAIDMHKQAESGYGSESSLKRHGSIHSLASGTSLSTASTSSFKRGRGLREKLAEMDTFKEILSKQVDTLQSYFDACASAFQHYQKSFHDDVHDDLEEDIVDDVETRNQNGHLTSSSSHHPYHVFTINDGDNLGRYQDMVNIIQQHGAHAVDFKGESFTFKATTTGILTTLAHCIDLMGQREESWRKKLEKEVDKRKRYEEAYKALVQQEKLAKPMVLVGGPDYEEGPHCTMAEDEFYDAIDSALDKMEKEQEQKVELVKQSSMQRSLPATQSDDAHPLYEEMQRSVKNHLNRVRSPADLNSSWELVASDGELKVYKRELVEDGLVCDPVLAINTIKGVTAHEVCHYFWDPSVRLEWESTLDSTSVVEWLSSQTQITRQVYKRVWPTTQREALFWSTIQHVEGGDADSPDYWIVCNHSTDHPSLPANAAKMVRIRFDVSMICQTVVEPPAAGGEVTRDNLSCKIQYSAEVNPGGWAPASVVRMISRREAPKFLKMFAQYVIEKTRNLPIRF